MRKRCKGAPITTGRYFRIAEQTAADWSISFPAYAGTVATYDDFAALVGFSPPFPTRFWERWAWKRPLRADEY
jgi:hypothetical protein